MVGDTDFESQQDTGKDTMNPSYYQHRIKCTACGLHFIVCSDYEKWPEKGTTREQSLGEATGVIYCPECGTVGKVLVYAAKKVDGFIFQAVPGDTEGVRSYNA